jgi:excisionase family DNA binding protein
MSKKEKTKQPHHPLMDVGEVADFFGVSKLTIWRWDKSGEIPKSMKIGGIVRWKRDELEKWLSKWER